MSSPTSNAFRLAVLETYRERTDLGLLTPEAFARQTAALFPPIEEPIASGEAPDEEKA